jgi:predicted O-methyltransferase YrrM
MSDPRWTQVDDYVAGKLLKPDPALDAALAANQAGGLPAIDVSAVQGKFLHLLALATGARRILEVGTLGGYSTIWLARALGEGGRVVTLELDPHHAEVARANVDRAGIGDRVDIRVGPAADTLAAMAAAGEGPFDLVFIDADKQGNAAYFNHAVKLSRPGTTILVDNVVREGGVLDPRGDAAVQGTRALFDALAKDDRITATALQTVGAKKWDGFVMAVVK